MKASFRILYYRNPQFSACPSCNGLGKLHRSRSHNMFEQILRKTALIKTYRCSECGWRGFKSTLVLTKRSFKTIGIYLSLIAITALVVRYIILNYGIK